MTETTAMIERILPPEVVSREAVVDPPEVVLFPEEEAAIARAVDKRRREFRTVRHCARQALAELGIPAVALLPGERGAPRWPPGVVGSMTHCAGYRAAAVARREDLLTIGIDAEPHDPLPTGVLRYVALDAEQASLAELGAADRRVCWDRLLFCIKETVYKAWYPLTRRWLGFEQAALTINPAGSFVARLLVDPPVLGGVALTGFDGRWMVADGLVIAAITIPAPRSPRILRSERR